MRLVVVGGSDAGISAALRAREVDPSAEVTVVVADAFPNFSICGLPFFLSGETPDWRDLAHRTGPEIEAQGIALLLNHRATAVDPDRQVVAVTAPGGGRSELQYDRLIIGTGAEPILPPIPGLERPGVHVLHTMEHSFAVHEALTRDQTRSAVIVGAGYIGIEMADALRHRGLEVLLVEQLDSVLTTVDPELGALVAEELVGHGVEVRTGVRVEEIDERDGRLGLAGSGGFDRAADVVLVAVGVRPDTKLGHAAGVKLGAKGALAVNRRMETNIPHVFAAGDCVQTWHRLTEHDTYLPLGTTAHKQGRVAGENAVGGDRRFAGSVGTQVVKVFDLAVGRTGLRDHEAQDAGFEPVTVEGTFDDHKGYYPGATPLTIRVTGDARTGRLLGAQLVGHAGAQVAKRVDVFASALFHGMNVEDLADLDLAYTPPFSSPWDPVQLAAQAWERDRHLAAV